MLSRYRIVRGRRPPGDAAPRGILQDTRKHTRHCLRPTPELVARVLATGDAAAWRTFAAAYRRVLARRFAGDRAAFDHLAALATDDDVFLGCNCPTQQQPSVRRCHTWIALEFMRASYPRLRVVFPAVDGAPAAARATATRARRAGR